MFHKAKVSLSSPQIGELSLDCRRRSLIPSTQTLFLRICQLYFPLLCQLYFLKSANYISLTLSIVFLKIWQLYFSNSVNCISLNLPTAFLSLCQLYFSKSDSCISHTLSIVFLKIFQLYFLWFSQHVFQKSKVSLSSAQIRELNLDCRRRSLIPSTPIPTFNRRKREKSHLCDIFQVYLLCF